MLTLSLSLWARRCPLHFQIISNSLWYATIQVPRPPGTATEQQERVLPAHIPRALTPIISELCSKWASAYLVSFLPTRCRGMSRSEPGSGLAINVQSCCQSEMQLQVPPCQWRQVPAAENRYAVESFVSRERSVWAGRFTFREQSGGIWSIHLNQSSVWENLG